MDQLPAQWWSAGLHHMRSVRVQATVTLLHLLCARLRCALRFCSSISGCPSECLPHTTAFHAFHAAPMGHALSCVEVALQRALYSSLCILNCLPLMTHAVCPSQRGWVCQMWACCGLACGHHCTGAPVLVVTCRAHWIVRLVFCSTQMKYSARAPASARN